LKIDTTTTTLEGVANFSCDFSFFEVNESNAYYSQDAMDSLNNAYREHQHRLFWREAVAHDDSLEFQAVNLIFEAKLEKFTDRDKVLMKVLYSCPELRKDIDTLGGVVDWIIERRDLSEDEVVSLMLEYGDTL